MGTQGRGEEREHQGPRTPSLGFAAGGVSAGLPKHGGATAALFCHKEWKRPHVPEKEMEFLLSNGTVLGKAFIPLSGQRRFFACFSFPQHTTLQTFLPSLQMSQGAAPGTSLSPAQPAPSTRSGCRTHPAPRGHGRGSGRELQHRSGLQGLTKKQADDGRRADGRTSGWMGRESHRAAELHWLHKWWV